MSFSLSKKTDRAYESDCFVYSGDVSEVASKWRTSGYEDEEVKDILQRLEVTLLSDWKEELDVGPIVLFLKPILKDAKKRKSGFTFIIDYDPKRVLGMIRFKPGEIVGEAILEGLRRGTIPRSLGSTDKLLGGGAASPT